MISTPYLQVQSDIADYNFGLLYYLFSNYIYSRIIMKFAINPTLMNTLLTSYNLGLELGEDTFC